MIFSWRSSISLTLLALVLVPSHAASQTGEVTVPDEEATVPDETAADGSQKVVAADTGEILIVAPSDRLTLRALNARPDEVVCRFLTPTGTRFKVRTCRTRETWNRIELTERSEARTLIDRGGIGGLGVSE